MVNWTKQHAGGQIRPRRPSQTRDDLERLDTAAFNEFLASRGIDLRVVDDPPAEKQKLPSAGVARYNRPR